MSDEARLRSREYAMRYELNRLGLWQEYERNYRLAVARFDFRLAMQRALWTAVQQMKRSLVDA